MNHGNSDMFSESSLEKNCKAELTEIHSVVDQACIKMDEHETFMVMIEKDILITFNDIISAVASKLDMKVNLDDLNWIILVQ